MKKICLVDDSSIIRSMLKTSLISEYEVLEAENGEDAINKLKGTPVIDLFLLDVNMPIMDGLTLLKEIRKLPAYTSTPVIMLTTETKEERREEAKKNGATGWIVKPSETEKLLSTLKKII